MPYHSIARTQPGLKCLHYQVIALGELAIRH